uniref:Uncharacterized protein n=1 Tax=Anguilla anguilla TaxID=7936 RepID=A0A0E9VVV2_ANGAN
MGSPLSLVPSKVTSLLPQGVFPLPLLP